MPPLVPQDFGDMGQAAASSISDLISSRPVVVVAGLLAFVILFAGIAYLGRHFGRTAGGRLRRALASHDAVTILLHPNPDPDAMAAGIGVREIASNVDTDVALQYPGQIRHQENRAFETVLDLDLDGIDSAEEIEYEEIVLVDHNEARGFQGAKHLSPIAVIDHHPGEGTGCEVTDVRPDYGACSTIIAEYFSELGIEPINPDEQPNDVSKTMSTEVGTGLLYGIQSDTNNLTSGCSPAEFEAASYLYPGVDEEALQRIANPEVDAEVLDVKARAIRDRNVDGSFACSDVGTISNVDSIPQAADELVRLEGVTAVVVLGECDDTIHLSGRSRDDRVHMGKALKAVVEDIPMAEAGGHARMGGGQVPTDHLDVSGEYDISTDELMTRSFEAMTGNRH